MKHSSEFASVSGSVRPAASRGGSTRVRQGNDDGFTLVELLVVIVILGILSAVAVFAVRGSGEKGKAAAEATDKRTIRTALEVYCAQKGQYPKAETPSPPGKDAMQVLVDEKFLGSRSGYWSLTTEGANVLEGNCPGVGPQRYRLDPIGTIAAQQPVCPQSVPNCSVLTGLKAVAGGRLHSVGLKEDGTVLAWGNNLYGQVGFGAGQGVDVLTAVPVSGLSGITAIAAGGDRSMALGTDGTVWFWGRARQQSSCQTGCGTIPPEQVKNLSNVTAIAAGGEHYLALKRDGTVSAWGRNNFGQLGNGTVDPFNLAVSSVPTPVIGLSGVSAIAAGDEHSLALVKSDGTVRAWGSNGHGRLGNGPNRPQSPIPVQVSDLSGVTAVAGALTHSLALKSDGTVWAWGYNRYGELGNGTTNDGSSIPVRVSGLSDVFLIDGGGFHSVAAKRDGTVWAWGSNTSGQLGNGTTNGSKIPVEVNGLSGVTAVAAGAGQSLAVKGDKTARPWGSNQFGQLGNGTKTDNSSPSTAVFTSGP